MHRATLMWLWNRFPMFLAFLIFDTNRPFCTGYSLCKMARFQDRLISRIFGVFSAISFCIHFLQPRSALTLKCPMK